jgi:hypothetical protein
MLHTRKMVILTSYFSGETYGLLGPQIAATIIEEETPYECIVLAVAREDDKGGLTRALADYFGSQRPVVGFSTLSGRMDLFDLARELRENGAVTILAGPQADTDFLGEKGWRSHPHRFPGLSQHFSFALHGPAEQIIPYLNGVETLIEQPGFIQLAENGTVFQNPKKPWDGTFLTKVRWGNLFRLKEGTLTAHPVSTAQVLQHLGCPHASRPDSVKIPYPSFMRGGEGRSVTLHLKGCSFCDVAIDKGFHGGLGMETVIAQIEHLPEEKDGRKIPFELINENPLPGLQRLLQALREKGIGLSQVNLTMRADWLTHGEELLVQALRTAREMRIRIFLSSVGFESFDDGILQNLHKGLTVEANLRAVELMRRMKGLFPFQWGYSRGEGAVHGFIHPTPWDTADTGERIRKVMDRHRLESDILPNHSVPLIIHHASGLGDWIREIEEREALRFQRYGSVIGWWEEALLKE